MPTLTPRSAREGFSEGPRVTLRVFCVKKGENEAKTRQIPIQTPGWCLPPASRLQRSSVAIKANQHWHIRGSRVVHSEQRCFCCAESSARLPAEAQSAAGTPLITGEGEEVICIQCQNIISRTPAAQTPLHRAVGKHTAILISRYTSWTQLSE